MKRAPLTEELRQIAQSFKPWLFWWPCIVCGQRFKSEPGWRLRKWIGPEGHFEWEAVCAECCPTEAAAYAAITSPVRRKAP